jgi:hypothetical protein
MLSRTMDVPPYLRKSRLQRGKAPAGAMKPIPVVNDVLGMSIVLWTRRSKGFSKRTRKSIIETLINYSECRAFGIIKMRYKAIFPY